MSFSERIDDEKDIAAMVRNARGKINIDSFKSKKKSIVNIMWIYLTIWSGTK